MPEVGKLYTWLNDGTICTVVGVRPAVSQDGRYRVDYLCRGVLSCGNYLPDEWADDWHEVDCDA